MDSNRSASAPATQFRKELGEGGQYVNRQQCVHHTKKNQLLLITLHNLILNKNLKVRIITKYKDLYFIYFNN